MEIKEMETTEMVMKEMDDQVFIYFQSNYSETS